MKNYDRSIYKMWMQMILENARFPKNFAQKEVREIDALKLLVRHEAENARYLWEVFNTERGQLTKKLLAQPKYALAYILGFHLPNATRMWETLLRCNNRWQLEFAFKKMDAIDVVDLGCGTGAMSQSILLFLQNSHFNKKIHFYLVEPLSRLLQAAKLGLTHLQDGASENISSSRTSLDMWTPPKFQSQEKKLTLLSLGYVWNELEKNPRAQKSILYTLEQLQKQHSLITLLEPASERISRKVLELHETMLQMGYKTLYPCPHLNSCPMHESKRDWCYSEFAWERPTLQLYIDKFLGLHRNVLASTAMVFASPSFFAELNHQVTVAPVVVGRPQDRKNSRSFSYLLCSKSKGLQKAPGDGEIVLRGEFL